MVVCYLKYLEKNMKKLSVITIKKTQEYKPQTQCATKWFTQVQIYLHKTVIWITCSSVWRNFYINLADKVKKIKKTSGRLKIVNHNQLISLDDCFNF